MEKKYDLIVVGAGVCGCVIAHLAAKLRKRVLIVERRNEIGGYVHARDGMTYFHTDNKAIAAFAQSISKWDSNFLTAEPLSGSDSDTILSPINYKSIDSMLDGETACTLKYRLIEKYGPVQFVTLFDVLRSDDDLIRSWGKRVFKQLYTKYAHTHKFYRESVSSWIVHHKRIYFSYYSPMFDNSFQIKPCGGYVEWFSGLISSPYINVKSGCDALDYLVFKEEDHVVFWDKQETSIPIVYTGELDLLFQKKYGELSYFRGCPLKDKTNLERVKKYKSEASSYTNLILCGRLAEFEFFFMDDAIIHAMDTFSKITLTVKIKGREGELLIESGNNLLKNEGVRSNLVLGDMTRPVPDVTILIPTFHRPYILREALRSAIEQSCPKDNYDILILDNGNGDKETEKVVKSQWHSNMYYYRNEKNLGAYGNMNRGMELARSKWVCMLHDDDWLLPDAIQYVYEALKVLQGKKLGAVLPRRIDVFSGECQTWENEVTILNWKHRLREWAIRHTQDRFWKITEFDYYMFPYLYPAPSYGTLFNREAFLEVGGMADEYPCEDGFFLLKLARTYDCFLCGQTWGKYRFVQNGGFRPYDLLQSVHGAQKYREYVSSKDVRAWVHRKIFGKASYQIEIDSALYWERRMNSFNQSRENFEYADQFIVGEKNLKWAARLKKIWEVYTLLRGSVFGVRAIEHERSEKIDRLQRKDYWSIIFSQRY